MLLDVFDQAFLILPHLEEVVVLADAFDWPFAVRAEAVRHIFFGPESFIKCTVPPSIVILVNQLVSVKLLKVSLNDSFVLSIGGPDKGVVGNVQPFPKGLKLGSQLVAMDLRVDAGFGRSLLNFLSMFIEPGEKEDIASSEAPIASEDIGSHSGIGMPDMRHVVHVIDRCRDVEGVGSTHGAWQKISGNKR